MRVIPLLILVHLFNFSLAQRIKNFKLYASNFSVTIKFVVGAGSTCDGFSVLHSLDSISFREVYNYGGICGLSEQDDPRSAVHTDPAIDRLNYYRIRLSTVETSDVEKIFVNGAPREALSIFPNPVPPGLNSVSLKFVGADNTKLTGTLFDTFGKAVKLLELFTTGDVAELDVSTLRNGVYLLRFTNGNERFNAKCVVLH